MERDPREQSWSHLEKLQSLIASSLVLARLVPIWESHFAWFIMQYLYVLFCTIVHSVSGDNRKLGGLTNRFVPEKMWRPSICVIVMVCELCTHNRF